MSKEKNQKPKRQELKEKSQSDTKEHTISIKLSIELYNRLVRQAVIEKCSVEELVALVVKEQADTK
ncbi:MAG: hypothetical protein Q4F38_05540 [Akkermansia sp.]|nr:hypothetical protein [Akkermansia sp.]